MQTWLTKSGTGVVTGILATVLVGYAWQSRETRRTLAALHAATGQLTRHTADLAAIDARLQRLEAARERSASRDDLDALRADTRRLCAALETQIVRVPATEVVVASGPE